MTASNTHGATQSGCMHAFDKLPKSLRVALANADHNWSGEQLYHARKNKAHPGNAKVRTIALSLAFLKQQDARKHNADAANGLIMGGQR